MNRLAVNVSCFRNYRTPEGPRDVPLLAWLRSSKYASQVERIRTLTDKGERDALKATLPAITPSGTFSRRGNNDLIQHSGLIALDLDGHDNPAVENWGALKEELCRLPEIAYFGLSVSGTGYWALIPISTPERHTEHFSALQRDFSALGLVIDAVCGDVARLRGYSYDPDAYFNPRAIPYAKLYTPPPPVASCKRESTGDAPGDRFNATTDILELLQDDDWTVVRTSGDMVYLNRPGASNPKGVDATVFTAKNKVHFRCSQSSLDRHGLTEGATYSPFGYLACTAYGGDFSMCAKDLAGTVEKEELPEGWTRDESLGTLLDADGIPAIWMEGRTDPHERACVDREASNINGRALPR